MNIDEDGHCRHCIPECISTDEWHIRETGTPNSGVLTTGCIACDEAERIVAFMRKEADNAMQYEWPEQHAILRVADFIEDGEHVRGEK